MKQKEFEEEEENDGGRRRADANPSGDRAHWQADRLQLNGDELGDRPVFISAGIEPGPTLQRNTRLQQISDSLDSSV